MHIYILNNSRYDEDFKSVVSKLDACKTLPNQKKKKVFTPNRSFSEGIVLVV